MATDKDYYKTLGVDKKASKDDIKKAFKKLAMKYHPDRAPEEKKKEYEEKFKVINEAVSVLGDDKKRQQYDQFGSSSFSGQAGFEGYDFSDIMSQFRSGAFGNFDDIFEHVFGGGGSTAGRVRRGRRGADLLYETEITLEEAAKSSKKTISLNKLEHCKNCEGRGALHFESCPQCHGSGYLQRTTRTAFGIFQQSGPCGSCQGRGEVAKDACSECQGEGLVRKKKKLEVTIPAGVEEGMRLRVPGEGEVGDHGPAGDLYLQVHLQPHAYFTREEANLHLTVPISFTQAALGDEVEVPTIDGKAILKIPAGTDSETLFRMRGKGMPTLRGEKGDQLVKVRIEVPKRLSKKEADLIKQLNEEKPSKNVFSRMFGG
ncbi:MAG: molecular chaperone DnaJ [Nanoarchaeota archaeon]